MKCALKNWNKIKFEVQLKTMSNIWSANESLTHTTTIRKKRESLLILTICR